MVKATVTDSLGQFILDEVKLNNYILKIQMIGFLPVRMNLQLDANNKNIDLQSIQITTDSKLLDGVEVVAHKDLIKKTTKVLSIQAKIISVRLVVLLPICLETRPQLLLTLKAMT